ncbi:MAG: hypothetical protein NW226_23410 [Microscillaceae bacterium]|nr:hypothetical protein [Microscillaceae bacterium]
MTHITMITTVGTSMFTNYFDKNETSPLKSGIWKTIRDKTFTQEEYDKQSKKPPFQQLEQVVEQGLNDKVFSCAELDTIDAIKKNYATENVEYHLLCSETIAGVLAGKILEKKLAQAKSNQIIEKLQTKIPKEFKEKVFLDLVEKVQRIAEKINKERKAIDTLLTKDKKKIKDYIKNISEEDKAIEPFKIFLDKPNDGESWKDFIETSEIQERIQVITNKAIVINYSGGYKAIIPYLTILGQLYDYDLAYMHEDGGELIDTKRLPFNFDVSLAEQYYPYLTVLSSGEREDRNELSNTSMQLTKENVLQKAQNQIQEMKDYQLLDSENKITAFGSLILEYIRSTNAIEKTTLGHFAEYKMFEYFYDHHRSDYEYLERAFKPVEDKENNPNINYIGDADLRLNVSGNIFDWVEIKGFGSVFELGKDEKWRVVERIRDRHAYQTSNFEGSHIRNYKFIMYKYEADKISLLDEVVNKMKTEFQNVQVYYFNIPLNQNKNPYFSFMQDKMKKEDLISL